MINVVDSGLLLTLNQHGFNVSRSPLADLSLGPPTSSASLVSGQLVRSFARRPDAIDTGLSVK